MAPLGWSGGSQFSSTVLQVGAPVMVSMRGGEGAAGKCGEVYSMIKGDNEISHLWKAESFETYRQSLNKNML